MDHLMRLHAPITDEAWSQIDDEARERLVPALAARKLVDFSGPHGWRHSATDLGRAESIDGLDESLRARRRKVLPVVELRAAFSVSRDELADASRGALDLDLASLDRAVAQVARAENIAVFHGWAEAGIAGIAESSPYGVMSLGGAYADYPGRVAAAVETLHCAGVRGPYGLALDPDGYTGVVETTEQGGVVVFDHLRQILDGPIVWAPGVRGAVVVSLRGGDFVFECGQDLAIGYEGHDTENVHLYIEESFTFRAISPDAAISLGP